MKKILNFIISKAKYSLLLFYFGLPLQNFAQYFAPAAGFEGTTAIYKDSLIFKGWANSCTVVRGFMDIEKPELGYASSGEAINATGKADGIGVVSLGDKGVAILTFDEPITNGNGADFAVFENGFFKSVGQPDAFLELAFVEVSSDGFHFFRFPAQFNGNSPVQMGPFGWANAKTIHNLAGKYTANYGTPFDLSDLKASVFLDKNKIIQVKIIDVIGEINSSFSTYDAQANVINDPYPTPFPSSGFDLDAVGVINVATKITDVISVFPNPCTDYIQINNPEKVEITYTIYNSVGSLFYSCKTDQNIKVDVSNWKNGLYLVVSTRKNSKPTAFLKI